MIKAFAYCFPGVLLPLFQAEQHLCTFFKTSLTIFPCCGIVIKSTTWARSSAGSASVSLLCPTELWAFKWGVCRLVAQPSHAPKYGPIDQLGERSVRIREVKGSNPSRSTNLPHRFYTMRRFLCPKNFGRPCRAPNPEVGCEPGGVINVLFENPSVLRFFLYVLHGAAGKSIAFMPLSRKFLQRFPRHRRLIQP